MCLSQSIENVGVDISIGGHFEPYLSNIEDLNLTLVIRKIDTVKWLRFLGSYKSIKIHQN